MPVPAALFPETSGMNTPSPIQIPAGFPDVKYIISTIVLTVTIHTGECLSQARIDSLFILSAYGGRADSIVSAAMKSEIGFRRLAMMCDTFGPRLSGSANLERAIDWVVDTMESDGFDDVRTDSVLVPRWVRGAEKIEMREPHQRVLPALGLGGSIGTPDDGIVAEALVVRNFAELTRRSAEASGRIVIFNVPFTTYGETVRYRSIGAIEAAKAGAAASLIRSVTPMSHQIPHTGAMHYADSVPQIPHAAITTEDAEMMQRIQDEGQRILLSVRMEARTLPDTLSRNLMAEIRGSERPEEIVLLGGHIDSWDVGQGAQDDAGGCLASWEALRLLKALGLRAKRTIRVVFWTNEENGLRGGNAYFRAHAEEHDRTVLAIESDGGIFQPLGFGFTGSDRAYEMVQALAPLLRPIGAADMSRGGGGVDISPLTRIGVPSMGLNVEPSMYFWYHHSDADTVDKIRPADFQRCVAALAIVAFVAADLPVTLPREFPPSSR